MKKFKSLFALLICLVCVVCLFLFRQVPKGQLWKGYSVLYVPVETSDQVVVNVLNELEIKNYICLSNQFLPLKVDLHSPEYSMLKLNIQKDDFSYIYDRNGYFFDKNGDYRIYYIPFEYSQNFSTLVKNLSEWNIPANIDSKTQYPVFLPVLFTILCVILCCFSKNKILFGSSVIFPILFVFANPFYQIVLARCLLLIILFIISNIWNRKGSINRLLSCFYLYPILGIYLISSVGTSVGVVFLSVLEMFSILSVYVIFYDIVSWKNRESFTFVKIKPARLVSIFADKQFLIFSSILVSMLCIFGCLFFISSNSSKISKSENEVLLPCLVSESENQSNLPMLEDYYKWVWNVQTFPYRSLNENQQETVVEFSRFVQSENGIVQKNEVMFFDDEYKQNLETQIDSIGENSIEFMLRTQNQDLTPCFSSSGSFQINNFSLVMCFICFFILLFIYFSIIIQKGVKK